MAGDVVSDSLIAWPPGTTSWQPDANTVDGNNPQDSDLMVSTAPTALAGNLRRIKSDTRGLSLNSGWICYLGLDTAPSPGNAAPVPLLPSSFTLAGDWRPIAQPARRVRASFSADGATIASTAIATILSATFVGGTTTVLTDNPTFMTPPAGQTFAYVEFASVGSLAETLAAEALPSTNASPLFLTQLRGGNATRFVVPPLFGGTGTDASVWGGDLSGNVQPDTLGSPMAPIVAKLQGETLNAAPLVGGELDQVLHFDVASMAWLAASLATLQGGGFSGTAAAGTVVFPGSADTSTNPAVPLKLKWISTTAGISPANEVEGTAGPFNFDTPFVSGPPFLAWITGLTTPNGLTAIFIPDVADVASINVAYRNLDASPVPTAVEILIFAIGF
jgi:hypothetical protein